MSKTRPLAAALASAAVTPGHADLPADAITLAAPAVRVTVGAVGAIGVSKRMFW